MLPSKKPVYVKIKSSKPEFYPRMFKRIYSNFAIKRKIWPLIFVWYRWRHQNAAMERCYTKPVSKPNNRRSFWSLDWGKIGQGITWFSKSSHFKMLPVHRKTKSRCSCLQIPLVCRVFPKNSIFWPIILLWTVGNSKTLCSRGCFLGVWLDYSTNYFMFFCAGTRTKFYQALLYFRFLPIVLNLSCVSQQRKFHSTLKVFLR